MKIGIIGMGVVGNATAKVLGKAHEIIPYDKYKEPYKDTIKLKETNAVFICVPTPMKTNGQVDNSAIIDSFHVLDNIKYRGLVIIRSTSVSGTIDNLKEDLPFSCAVNPEFLRQEHALKDMMNTNKIIIGADREKDYKLIKKIYKPVFPKVRYIKTTIKEAEMIKYASNVVLTGQIAVANEIYQICKKLNINYNKIKDAVLLDHRVGRNIDVPGPDGKLGFGGACFPKDLNALIYLSCEEGYKPYLLEEIWRSNRR